MLMPALERARESAQAVTCKSNLKQTYLHAALFRNDEDVILPAYKSDPRWRDLGTRADVGWHGWELLYEGGYLSRGFIKKGVDPDFVNGAVAGGSTLICPKTRWGASDPDLKISSTTWHTAEGKWPSWESGNSGNWHCYSSYGINTYSCDSVDTDWKNEEYTTRGRWPRNPYFGDLSSSDRVFFLEVNVNTWEPRGKVAGGSLMASEYNFWKSAYNHRYRSGAHMEAANYLCADGHAGTLQEDLFLAIGSGGPNTYRAYYRNGDFPFGF
jgi:hypothetical protein